MPTVLIIEGFRFYFYSDEGNEPFHIHVKKAEAKGKICVMPNVEEDYFYGFTEQQKRKIRKIVKENYKLLIEKWNEYFK